MFGFEAERVMNDVVVCWIHGALGDILRYQIEVKPFGPSDRIIYDATTRRIYKRISVFGKKARITSLLHNDEC